MLQVRLLGRFEIVLNEQNVDIPSRPSQSLLAFLLLNPNKPLRRERLAGMFWPDASEANARSNLRHALWRIRKALEKDGEPAYMQADDLEVTFQLQAGDWLDVEILVSSSPTNQVETLQRQVQVYQGELLPGFYDEWITLERQRLQSVFESKMQMLVEELGRQGSWGEVIEQAEDWIAHGNTPELAYRSLMVAHAGQGNMASAAATYLRCEEVLRQEMGIEPSSQTRETYQLLLRGEKPIPLQAQPLPPAPGEAPFKGWQLYEKTKLHNLPAQVTSFIGREKEIEDIKGLLGKGDTPRYDMQRCDFESHPYTPTRLVTLTGPGGTGKTRLALEVGADLIEAFENGVWLVELAALSEDSLVPQRLASALEVKEEPGCPLMEALVKFVRDKQLLVILDNCEHLGQACAGLAMQLLKAAPRLKILATSRERLHINGETNYIVPPLTIPDPHQVISLKTLPMVEAVRVFIERAVAAQPDFRLTDHNAPAVAEICCHLEGIPLAIELAAARVRSLSVENIAEHIGDRFRILTGGDRTALPRHQTLRALIDWSYDLLGDSEQAMLRQLSVFAGGWTLEAAEAVCGSGAVDAFEVIDLLGNLVEKSLVRLEPETGRYGMLETLRQYAGEKLGTGAEMKTCRRAHFEYFLRLAESQRKQFGGPDQGIWIQRLENENDNLRAALQWSLEAGRGEEALHLCFVLGGFWEVGTISEGRAWTEKALALRESASQRAQAEGLYRAGALAFSQRDLEAAGCYLNESLVISRALEYDRLIAIILRLLAQFDYGLKELSARQMLEESLEIYQKLGDKFEISFVLLVLGVYWGDEGDHQRAQLFYGQSLALGREVGNIGTQAAALNNLGCIQYRDGNLETAKSLFEEALVIRRQMRDKIRVATILGNLGLIAIQQGEAELARQLWMERLTIHQAAGFFHFIGDNFAGIASVLRLEGQLIAAARMQGFVAAVQEQFHEKLEPENQLDYDLSAASLVSALGEDGYRQAFEAGKLMTIEQALELAQARGSEAG